MTRRWAVLVVGVLLLGVGVAMSITAGIGVGSWQVFETGLVDSTGLTFAVVVIAESFVALALAWFWLRVPPGPATVVIAFLIGPFVDVLLDVIPEPDALAWGIVQFGVGTTLIGIGVGLYVAADLGPSAQDALFVGLYRRYPIRPGVARFLLDGVLVLLGFALGGQLGIGTAMTIVLLPLAVEVSLPFGHRLAGTRDPRHVDPIAAPTGIT